MIKAENISFSYGENTILRQLSLCLAPGERFVLLGPSGSGKTTLLRLLCGLHKPQAGSICRPERIGVVFQEDRLLPTRSALENITLTAKDPLLARQIGQELGLADCFSHFPHSLSGGQRRRVALARALAFPCLALLMDEPFQGLDGLARRRAAETILKYQEDRSLFLISHQPEDALLLDASAVMLEDLMEKP